MASAGHPPPLLVARPRGRAGRRARHDRRRVRRRALAGGDGRARAAATCSCSTPTACSTRWGRTTASASGACARRSAGSRARVEERVAALRAELEAFERGPQRDDTTVLVLEYRGSALSRPSASRRAASSMTVGALAEREAHERAPGLRVVVEDARRDRDDAGALDELAAERGAVALAVDVGEVGPGGPQHLQPGGLEARAQVVALGAQVARERGVDLVAEPERDRARRAGTACRPRRSGTAWPCAPRPRARAGRPPSPSSSP